MYDGFDLSSVNALRDCLYRGGLYMMDLFTRQSGCLYSDVFALSPHHELAVGLRNCTYYISRDSKRGCHHSVEIIEGHFFSLDSMLWDDIDISLNCS